MPNPIQIGPSTHMRIIMTYMLTLTKAGSKEETDEIKIVQHLKKKSQKRPEVASLNLIHACQTHLLLFAVALSSKSFHSARPLPLHPLVTHKPDPYDLMHDWT